MVERSAHFGTLLRDRVFLATTGLVLLSLAPVLIPSFAEDAEWMWRWVYVDFPVAVAVFLAVWIGSASVASDAERKFWRLVAAARLIVVLIEAANSFIPDALFTDAVDLLVESGYLLYYAFFFLALRVAAGHGEATSSALDRIRAFALVTMALTAVVYFQLIPSTAYEGDPTWYPGLYIWGVLDTALCLAFLHLRRRVDDARWRSILAGMAAVSASWAVLDSAEATLYLPQLINLEFHPLWDIPWYAGELLLIIIARQFLGRPDEVSVAPVAASVPPPERGALVFALIALPLAHGILHAREVLDPALRTMRERVMALFIIVMSVQAIRYLRILGAQRERARIDAQLNAERYRSFVENRADSLFRGEPSIEIPIDSDPDLLVTAMARHVRIAEASGRSPEGADANELMGEPIISVLGGYSPGLRAFVARWQSAGCETATTEIETAGPTSRVLECALTGIVEDGRLLRVWVTHEDVTEARRAAEEARRMERELEQARRMETVGTLAGGIAHDFNNLLTPIMGHTELAAAAAERSGPEARRNLTLVMEASRRAADLVQQMLVVSRQQPAREEVVRLQDVVRTAMRLLRSGVPANVRFNVDLDDACPPVLGDPSRLHQVVMNLCTNAAQAMGARSGCIDVIVASEPPAEGRQGPSGWVRLTVRDDGPGMDPDIRSRVFEPFFSTKEPGAGSGLGLSVVHGIVVSHGGHVAVESTPGAGSTFSVLIPATDRLASTDTPVAALSSHPSRVLVLDDERDIASLAEKTLTKDGHSVRTFTQPTAALAALRDNPDAFDVILTDYSMPDMTGLDFLDEARRLGSSALPVVMSGYLIDERDALAGITLLSKPFTSTRLRETIAIASATSSIASGERSEAR